MNFSRRFCNSHLSVIVFTKHDYHNVQCVGNDDNVVIEVSFSRFDSCKIFM